MKKNTIILSSVILALLFLIWFQNFQYKKANKLQNEAHQKLILEKQRTDSLFTYYETIQKAQYYFLQDQDSLALDLLKPYGKISVGDQIFEVKSEEGFIDVGEEVEIIKIENNKISVK